MARFEVDAREKREPLEECCQSMARTGRPPTDDGQVRL